MQLGLMRTGGAPERFLNLLQRFPKSCGTSLEQIEEAMGAGNAPLAARLAHTLRGTAATLGIEGLEQRARALEAALKSGADWRTSLVEARQHLAPLLTALTTHFAPVAKAASLSDSNPPSLPTPDFDKGLLDLLSEQIERYDTQATVTIELLRAAFGPVAPPALDQLEEALANFDFDAAALALANLRPQFA